MLTKPYLVALNRTGVIQLQANNLTTAEAAYREAQALLVKLGGKPDSERSILLNGLGEIAWRKGNYRKADSLFHAVLQPYESDGRDHDRYFAAALKDRRAHV